MRLIQLTELIPIRNESGEIYKWQERPLAINPNNLQGASYREEVKKVVVSLTNGREMIIDHTMKELDSEFQRATT